MKMTKKNEAIYKKLGTETAQSKEKTLNHPSLALKLPRGAKREIRL
jgi:hypothetical protein